MALYIHGLLYFVNDDVATVRVLMGIVTGAVLGWWIYEYNNAKDWLWNANLYVGVLHWIILINATKTHGESIVDGVTMMNLCGVDNRSYTTTIMGMVWVVVASLAGVIYWGRLLWIMVQHPPLQQVLPVFPSAPGPLPAGTYEPSGKVLVAPARHRWRPQHKKE